MFCSFNRGGPGVVAMLTACLLVSACQTAKLGGEVKAVTEAEQPLVFSGPGLEDGYRSFTSGDPTGAYHTVTMAHYGPRSGSLPRASMQLYEASGGRHFTRSRTPFESMKLWTYFKDRNLTEVSDGVGVNPIGAIEYVIAGTSDNLSCVGFLQFYGNRTDAGLGTRRLIGYYCAPEGVTLSDADAKSIVKGISLRE
ncbi:MAG: hypothetical protein RIC36_20250 [Rhodospirillales bacterium]